MYKKQISLSIGLLISMNAFALSWQRKDVASPLAKKQATVLVYIAGDNSLADFIHLDLEEMQKIGSNQNVNILAYVSSKDNSSKWTRALVVQKGQALQDGPDMDKDSGAAQTAIDAVTWATSKFPSDNFVIVFWNHGSGPLNRNGLVSTFFGKPWGTPADRAFCYDDTTGSYFTDQDLIAVLEQAVQLRGGKKVDIVAFDACLMANVEVAYAASSYAKYLVASEETIPGQGYPYDTALNLASKPNLKAVKMAQDMVKDYGALYNSITTDYTLSAIDLSQIAGFKAALDHVATVILSFLSSKDADVIKLAIQASADPNRCTFFTENSFIDIGDFLNNLKANLGKAKVSDKALLKQLNNAIAAAVKALKSTVLAQVKGSDFPRASGISFYFERNAYLDSDYASTQWGQDSVWAQMLDGYINS